MKSPRFTFFFAVFVCLLLVTPALAVAGDEWRPVEPAELALKASTVEKDADAEALFWDVRVDDSSADLVLNHYIRIKIFTERGKENNTKVQIPYGNILGYEINIQDIAARTIRTDGTTVELKKGDVFETTQLKLSGVKIKVKSFAVPGIESGAIIEYRWREVRRETTANRLHLDYQRDVPIQRVTYRVKPSTRIIGALRIQMLNGVLPPATKEKDGFYAFTKTDVPAFREEPRMPPSDQVREWLFIYYTRYQTINADLYWRDHARSMFLQSSELLKVDDEVKRAAAEAVGDATSAGEKVRKIFDYTRAKVKNVNDPTLGLKREDRAKMKDNKTPSDTLKQGMGNGTDIDHLFAALCIAAGLDARRSATSDRGRIFFRKDFSDSYFLRNLLIAVKVDDKWLFLDPASRYVPFGMLRWQQEGVQALLADAEGTNWVGTQLSGPEKSREKRTAKFNLSEDGTLEGDVNLEFTGHMAMEIKTLYDEKSESERQNILTEVIKNRLSTAEVSEIKMENLTDMTKPAVISYHVKVAGYAQRTGKRLFLQPGFFIHGIPTPFSSTQREHDVYFPYGWSERDEIWFELPAGFVPDSADAPAPLKPEMTRQICAQQIKMDISNNARTLRYEREFFFGGGGSLLFPVSDYPGVKNLFDLMSKANEHTITLKQSTAN